MRDLIAVDPKVMRGKPVVAGTRITVEYILEQLGQGRTVDELVDTHPRVTREGVMAAVAYAIDALRAERVVAAGESRPELRARYGTDGDTVMHIGVEGGDLEPEREHPGSSVMLARVHTWDRVVVKTVVKGQNTIRYFEAVPSRGANEQEIRVGSLYVRGRIDLVRKLNRTQDALAAWKAWQAAPH